MFIWQFYKNRSIPLGLKNVLLKISCGLENEISLIFNQRETFSKVFILALSHRPSPMQILTLKRLQLMSIRVGIWIKLDVNISCNPIGIRAELGSWNLTSVKKLLVGVGYGAQYCPGKTSVIFETEKKWTQAFFLMLNRKCCLHHLVFKFPQISHLK